MLITLYKNYSEPNKLNKLLSNNKTFIGNLREASSVINPVILLEGEDLTDYNYMKIEEFNRYYFINNIESERRNIWRISASVDVLMSFKEEILQQDGIIEKNEFSFNNLYNDGSYINQVDTFKEVVEYPQGFDSSNTNFILITTGGGL